MKTGGDFPDDAADLEKAAEAVLAATRHALQEADKAIGADAKNAKLIAHATSDALKAVGNAQEANDENNIAMERYLKIISPGAVRTVAPRRVAACTPRPAPSARPPPSTAAGLPMVTSPTPRAAGAAAVERVRRVERMRRVERVRRRRWLPWTLPGTLAWPMRAALLHS